MLRYLSCILLSLFIAAIGFSQTEEKDLAAAKALIDKGQFDEAITAYTKLMTSYGEKEAFLTGRGFAYVQKNDHAHAIADYEKALTKNKDCSKCLGNIALLLVDDREFANAIPYLEKFIKLNPKDGMGYVKRGEAEFQTGKYDEAIADFNKGLEFDSTRGDYIYLYLAMTKLTKGDNAGALTDINKSIEANPAPFGYYTRGKIFIQMANYDAAWKDLANSLRNQPDVAEYHTYAGVALYYLNDYNKAMQALNESIRLDSTTDPTPYQFRSYILYSSAAFSRACEDRSIALDIARATGNDKAIATLQYEMDEYCDLQKASAHYHSGMILFGRADFERAMRAFNNGLSKFPDDPLLLEGKGNASIATGKFQDALNSYHSSLANLDKLIPATLINTSDPKQRDAAIDGWKSNLFNSLFFVYANLMQLDSAKEWLQKAIDVLKNNPLVENHNGRLAELLVKLSSLEYTMGDTKKAESHMNEALKINPTDGEAYQQRASWLVGKNTLDKNSGQMTTVFQPNAPGSNVDLKITTTPLPDWNRKEVEAALEDCNKAISLDPNNREAYMLRAQIKLLLKKEDYCPDVMKAIQLGIAKAADRLGVVCK